MSSNDDNPNPETYQDLCLFVQECFPHGELVLDNKGQYVIYTGLKAEEHPKKLEDPILIPF